MRDQKMKLPEPKLAWGWSRDQITNWQIQQFNRQLDQILPHNRFYTHKFQQAGIDLRQRLSCLEDLQQWPFTTKQELCESSRISGLSQHHTFANGHYARLHRTSGTTGQALMIQDTAEDWRWWSDTWQHVLDAAEVSQEDRVFLAFSFGPFIGFWSAHQACEDRGAMVIPGGGLSTLARLDFLRESKATVVCCTPTYALHLAEVADCENFCLADLPVRRLIVAGEAGGSVPEVRARISGLWRAQVVDHAGATEVGPWGFGWPDRSGLHIIETSFIAELLPVENLVQSHHPAARLGELVLTSLGRHGAPVIRYRTGDVVNLEDAHQSTHRPTEPRCNFLWLPQGTLGRADDMVTIRGVNVFPSSIDNWVRSIPEIGEYQVVLSRHNQLDQVKIIIEGDLSACSALEKQVALKTGLRITVESVPVASLPRSEGKSSRWKDLR